MKITIESTDEIVDKDGVPTVKWTGVTEGGIPLVLYVLGIDLPIGRGPDFEREAPELIPPNHWLVEPRNPAIRVLVNSYRPNVASASTEGAKS
jgi:hypothetical protein